MVDKISVVVPVFRSTQTVRTLVTELENVPDPSVSFEVVLVSDGNTNDVNEFLASIVSNIVTIKLVMLRRNYGQQPAIIAGCEQCTGDWIVTMDDDMQHSPYDIPCLIEKLKSGYDVCYGTPISSVHGSVRSWISRSVKKLLASVSGITSLEFASAYRAFNADLVSDLIRASRSPVNIDAILASLTNRITHVLIRHQARTVGKSNYSFHKLVDYSLRLTISHTSGPLRLALVMGTLCVLASLVVIVYFVTRWQLIGSSVPGYTSMICALSLFSGINLFVVGMVGEYVSVIFTRNSGSPMYSVRSIVVNGQTVTAGNRDLFKH